MMLLLLLMMLLLLFVLSTTGKRLRIKGRWLHTRSLENPTMLQLLPARCIALPNDDDDDDDDDSDDDDDRTAPLR